MEFLTLLAARGPRYFKRRNNWFLSRNEIHFKFHGFLTTCWEGILKIFRALFVPEESRCSVGFVQLLRQHPGGFKKLCVFFLGIYAFVECTLLNFAYTLSPFVKITKCVNVIFKLPHLPRIIRDLEKSGKLFLVR